MVSILFTLLTSLLLKTALSHAAQLSVPDPFGNLLERQQSWTIKSKRSYGLQETDSTPLIAEEYYLFSPLKATYHGQHILGSKKYNLMLRNGKVYESVESPDKDEENRAIQRCSPLRSVIKWPWRYQLASDKSFMVLGIGAVWLNALDMKDSFQCTEIEDEKGLKCIAQTELANVELNFDKNSLLVSGYVQDKSKRSENKTSSAKVEFQVEVLKDHLDGLAESEIDSVLKLCELAYDVKFPSLLAEMLDTRFWSQSFLVRNYDSATGNELTQYNMREEFNYEKSTQAFFKHTEALGTEMYLRNMSLHWTFDGMLRTMTYKIIDETCTIHDFEDELLNGEGQVHLTKRKLHFKNEQSGYIIGLSALFMNMADIRNKRVTVEGTTVDNKWRIEWIVGDGYGLQWYLGFPGQTYKDNQALLEQWTTLDLRKSSKRGGKGPLVASFRHISETTTELTSIQTFELPETCPPVADFLAQYQQGGEVPEVEIKDETQKNIDGEEQEKFEFPLLDQCLNLEESFVITSHWNFGNGTTIHLTERQQLQTGSNQDDGELLTRLDIITHHGLKDPTSYTLYIRHATGAIIQATSSSCRQVTSPEIWLHLNKLDELDFNPAETHINVDEWTPKPIGLYGIVGLWRQAELSSSLEFIHGTQKWRMSLGTDKVTVQFNFMIDEESKKPRLNTIEIDTSKTPELFKDVRKISIDSIVFKQIPLNGLDFVLPAHCEARMMDESHYPSPKFRFPAFQDRFNGLPTVVPFILEYQLITLLENGEKKLSRAIEIHNPNSDYGLFTLKFAKNNSINFWIHSSEHTFIEWNEDCKTTGDIAQIFEIEDWLFKDNKLLATESTNFLLANAWQLISARADPSFPANLEDAVELSVRSRQHMFNKKFQPILVDWILRNPKNNLSIKFTFFHGNSNSPPALQSVYFLNDKGEAKIHMTVVSISNQLKDITIPGVCTEKVNFPELVESIPNGFKEISHLRSEFSSNKPYEDGSTNQLFIVDEWLYPGNGYNLTYRITTKNLNSKKDYLVISETGELFDLTKIVSNIPMCETVNIQPGIDPSAIWLNDRLLGPLWIWLIAKRNPLQVRVTQSIDRITLSEILTFTDMDISRRMKSRSWKVSPKNGGQEFKFHFSLVNEEDGVGRFELEQVDLWQSFHSLKLEPQRVLVQVVSFVSRPMEDQEFSQRLIIPKGRGCRRTSFAKQYKRAKVRDVIVFGTSSPLTLRYYSYLKLAQDESTTQTMRPVVHEGSLSWCPAIWFTIPVGTIKVNHQRTVPLNGSQPVSQRKVVTQEPFSKAKSDGKQIYTLNEVSGQCSIERRAEEELLRFNFELPVEEQVVIDSNFLDRLLASKGFELIQSREGVARVYERDWSHVNLTSTLSGPAIITRTFELGSQPGTAVYGDLWYHSSVNIEILWPSRALLYLKIFNLKFKDCHDIVREDARPNDCVQTSEMRPKEKIRYFKFSIAHSNSKIKYQELLEMRKSLEISVKDSMLSHFKGRLSLIQFGDTSIAINREEAFTAVLQLSLIEPPEPIEYFEQINNQRLSSQGPVKLKPMENEFACSDWCAFNQCKAFSYCLSDRICRIVEEFTKTNSNATGCCDLASELGCKLWKATNGILRPSIQSLMAELKEDVAMNRFSVDLISVGARFEVVSINELNGILEQEDEQGQRQLDNNDIKQDVFSFLLVKPNARLILTEENSNQFNELRKVKLYDCMKSCSGSGCQLFSYCPKDETCTMLVNLDSYSSYSTNMKAVFSNERCSTYSEDFVANYQHFPVTSRPKSSEVELDDLSLQECAARCDLGQPEQSFVCVAFDYCHLGSSESSKPKCYLQSLHVNMEDFDESVLVKPEEPESSNGTLEVCSHYSSTFMRDFIPHNNRRFQSHSLFTYNLDLQKCAMICRAHRDTCLAFEHCHSNMSSHDTCFVHHLKHQQLPEGDNCSTSAADTCHSGNQLEDDSLLVLSDNCTVYEFRWKASHQETMTQTDMRGSETKPVIFPEVGPFALESTVIYALAALLGGLIVQIAYIRCR